MHRMDHISDLMLNVIDFVDRNGIDAAEKIFIEWLSFLMIVSAFVVGISLFVLKFKISYGRYSKESMLSEVYLTYL